MHFYFYSRVFQIVIPLIALKLNRRKKAKIFSPPRHEDTKKKLSAFVS
jgi:hypothetical protein